jgi:hypothetical protein
MISAGKQVSGTLRVFVGRILHRPAQGSRLIDLREKVQSITFCEIAQEMRAATAELRCAGIVGTAIPHTKARRASD